jgi:superfamily II DNA or RNA helicase
MFDATVKVVEDIEIGDVLMGPDGGPRTVTALHCGEDEMFSIIPQRGNPWAVNKGHILTLMHYNDGRIVDVPLSEMLAVSLPTPEWRLWRSAGEVMKAADWLHKSRIVARYIEGPPEFTSSFTIEPLGRSQYFGFTLDGDGRYLLDDFTVTHNSGKTVLAANMIMSAVNKGSRILFLAGSRELIFQPSKKLDEMGIDHGIIMGNHKRKKPSCRVQVASIPTLIKRLEHKPQADLIFIDEIQHIRSKSWSTCLDAYPGVPVIGLSAYPRRRDGKGLGEVFEDYVVAATVKELTNQGFLVPVTGFGYDEPDLSEIHTQLGDYKIDELSEKMRKVVLSGNMIHQWKEHSAGKRTVVFAVDIEHSKAIIEQFVAEGIKAEHVDGEMDVNLRDAILERLRTGETTVVSNCSILVEGWDQPSVETAILMRPTQSTSLAIQQMGRILRPWCHTCQTATKPTCVPAGHNVKRSARIHDHANVLMRHGAPDEDRDVSLTNDGVVRDQRESLKTCKKCYAIVRTFISICPVCNTAFEKSAGDPGTQIILVDGKPIDMEEIRRRRAQMGLGREFTPEQLVKVLHATRGEQIAEYKRLVEVQQSQGLKAGFVAHAYREIWGVWPKFTESDLVEVSAARAPFLPLPPKEERIQRQLMIEEAKNAKKFPERSPQENEDFGDF